MQSLSSFLASTGGTALCISKTLRLSVLSILLVTVLESQQQQPWVLPEGTPVRMRINRTVSSADATEGGSVDFETLDDVLVNGVVVIPKGSLAMATITDAVPKRRMARGGKLAVNIDYLRLPNQEKLPLRGVQDLKGGGHTGAMTGGMVATAIVFFPAAPFFLFMKGKDVTIPKGHEVTCYTNTEYKLDASKLTNSSTPGAATPNVSSAPAANVGTKPLTNEDIVKMKNAGFSDELIVSKIQTSRGDYKLETDDLVDMKKVGISEQVLKAMMTAPK